MRNLYNPQTFQSEVDDLYNGTLIPRKVRPVTVAGTGVINGVRRLPAKTALPS
jgi:hypothetical protein